MDRGGIVTSVKYFLIMVVRQYSVIINDILVQ